MSGFVTQGDGILLAPDVLSTCRGWLLGPQCPLGGSKALWWEVAQMAACLVGSKCPLAQSVVAAVGSTWMLPARSAQSCLGPSTGDFLW